MERASHLAPDLPVNEQPHTTVIPHELLPLPDPQDMTWQDVREIFGISKDTGPFFPISRSNLMPVPKELGICTTESLISIKLSEYELGEFTTCHDRLGMGPDEPRRHLGFTRDSRLQITATNRGKNKEIIGQADYCIWPGNESTSSGVVITAVEDCRDLGPMKLRCFAYMTIARSMRKQIPTIVYGISTDGVDFQFMNVDSTGKDTSTAIYTILRLALRHPAAPPFIPDLIVCQGRPYWATLALTKDRNASPSIVNPV
ncbi:hypothetical protein BJX76DRAFT_351265 [Aspergillus varians]